VVMPNHVHAIVWFAATERLSRFMHGWKRKSPKTWTCPLPRRPSQPLS
jgi:REP element-mobilizing transposase RayT